MADSSNASRDQSDDGSVQIWVMVQGFWKKPRSRYLFELLSQEFWKIFDPSNAGQIGESSNDLFTELHFNTSAIRSKLRVWGCAAENPKDLILSIVGSSADIQSERETWIQIIDNAVNRVDEEPESFSWNCIIGPLPESYPRIFKTVSSITLGSTVIDPSQKITWESFPSFIYGVEGGYICESWPLKLHGIARTYVEHETVLLALEEATSVCLLLTLALNQAWAPRNQPQLDSEYESQIPSFAQNAIWLREDGWPPSHWGSEAIEIDLAAWFVEAWNALRKRQGNKMRNALFMFREGIILAHNHPSISRVAFTAAIEAFAVSGKVSKCETCGSPIGLTQAFKDAVRLENSPRLSERYEKAYSARSKTVHDGKVSSSELRANLPSWIADSRDFYVEPPVGIPGPGSLRNRCRELILAELQLHDPIEGLF